MGLPMVCTRCSLNEKLPGARRVEVRVLKTISGFQLALAATILPDVPSPRLAGLGWKFLRRRKSLAFGWRAQAVCSNCRMGPRLGVGPCSLRPVSLLENWTCPGWIG